MIRALSMASILSFALFSMGTVLAQDQAVPPAAPAVVGKSLDRPMVSIFM